MPDATGKTVIAAKLEAAKSTTAQTALATIHTALDNAITAKDWKLVRVKADALSVAAGELSAARLP